MVAKTELKKQQQKTLMIAVYLLRFTEVHQPVVQEHLFCDIVYIATEHIWNFQVEDLKRQEEQRLAEEARRQAAEEEARRAEEQARLQEDSRKQEELKYRNENKYVYCTG